MRARLWLALLMFLSGYSPLLAILCYRDFDFGKHQFSHIDIVALALGICVFSIFATFLAIRTITGGTSIQILGVRSRATDLVNYALPYIVSFMSLDLGSGRDMGSLAFFLLILFVLAYRTNCLFINPILALAGYQLFEVTYSDNNVEKQRDALVHGDLAPGEICRAEKLSSSLLFITQNYGRRRQDTLSQGNVEELKEPRLPARSGELMASA